MFCALCGGKVRRRWWEWGILRPLPVHDWRDAETCNKRRAA